MNNTYLMKKAMIEAAVTRGIRQMEEDPERSARRLADLGKQFSGNRFQEIVFSVIQELLDNENSAYYDMIHNVLKNTNHDAMRTFGVNFGYMSFAYGASKIRDEEKVLGYCIPWCLMLRYDETLKEGLSLDDLRKLMEEGQELGIYAYFIRQSANSVGSYSLLTLLERCKDSSFIWFQESGRLTAAQIQMLKVCKNTVVALPVLDDESMLTAELLRDQKVPFALYSTYDDQFAGETVNRIMEHVLASETSMFFLIAEDGTALNVTKYCYDSRLEQDYPCVLMDYYGDGRSISRILAEHDNLLEIGADGYVIRPDGSRGARFPSELPLKEALAEIMPPFTAASHHNRQRTETIQKK